MYPYTLNLNRKKRIKNKDFALKRPILGCLYKPSKKKDKKKPRV